MPEGARRLTTERMVLVAATADHLRAELEGRDRLAATLDAEVPASWPPPLNDESSLRFTLRSLENDPGAAGWIMWYFLIRGQDGNLTAIGCGGFAGKPAPDGTVEVGYSILESHQRRGLAGEAVRALAAWAFARPEVRRVIAQTMPDMTASQRVLEKCGFRFLGQGMEKGAILYELAGTRRALGRTPIRVSPIGLGCWQLSGGQGLIGRYWPALGARTEEAIVAASVEEGVSWFDTAEVYGGGTSERTLARALASLPRTPEDLVIATKWFPVMRFAGNIRTTIGRRLGALGGRTIDLYQIHHWFSLSPVAAQMNAMADLVERGAIRAVGVSNYGARAMRKAHAALARRGIPLASNQVEYSLLKRQAESNGVVEAARELGVTLIAYSPLAQGILAGKFHDDPGLVAARPGPRRRLPAFQPKALARSRRLVDVLKEVGARHDATPAQVALAWTTTFHGGIMIAIPGATSVEQARSNAGSMRISLSREDLDRIDQASREAAG